LPGFSIQPYGSSSLVWWSLISLLSFLNWHAKIVCIYGISCVMSWYRYTMHNTQVTVSISVSWTFIISLWWKYSKSFLLAFLKYIVYYNYSSWLKWTIEHQTLLLLSIYNLEPFDDPFFIPSLPSTHHSQWPLFYSQLLWDWLILDSMYELDHAVFAFLCLAYFTLHNIFSCGLSNDKISSFCGWIVFHYIYILFTIFFISWWTLRLIPFFGYYKWYPN
jgi:hypothetical protein